MSATTGSSTKGLKFYLKSICYAGAFLFLLIFLNSPASPFKIHQAYAASCTGLTWTAAVGQSSATIPTTGQYLGAFKAACGTTGGGATSITVTTLKLTLSNATGITNLKVFNDAVTNCTTSSSFTGQFGSTVTAPTTTTDANSFTGTSTSINSTGFTCFYVVADIGTGAANGATEIVKINSSTSITQSSGTISASPSFPLSLATTTLNRILTVSTTGTQTSSVSAGTTNFFVGGAFTMTSTDSQTVTGINITISGTGLTASDISNMRLHTDTAASCSTSSFTAGVNQYGSTIAAPAVGSNAFSGSAAVGTGTTCFYVVIDITAAGAGHAMDLSINASTDVTAAGTESGSFPVMISGSTTINAPPATISGTLYDTNGSSALLVADTIKASIGGAASASGTSSVSDGTFTITLASNPSAGNIITVWISGDASNQGALVFRYGSSCTGTPNCTGLSIIKNRVVLSSFDGSNITNSNLSACTNSVGTGCSTTDIGFTDTSSNLVLTYATNILQINSGTTYAPGGNVTAQKMNVQGTYSGSTETLNLSGAGSSTTCGATTQIPLCVSGTFTVPSITTYSTTSSTNILLTAYNNLNLQPSSAGSPTYTLGTGASQTLTVNNTLTIGDGTDPVTVTASANNPAINLLGALTINASATYTKGSGTTTFKAGTTQTLTDNTSGQDLGAVVIAINSTNTTLSLATSAKMTSLTVNASQTFTANGSNTLIITGSGTAASRPLQVASGGVFTQSSGTVEFIGTSATEISDLTSDNITYNSLKLDPAGTVTYSIGTAASQSLQVNGTFTVGNGTNVVTVTAATYNPTLFFKGDVTINAAAIYTKGSSLTTINGGITQNFTDNTSTLQDLGALQVSAGAGATTMSQSTSLKATSLKIDLSQIFTANGANTLTLTGSGTGASRPLQISGTFTQSTGTVEYVGTSTTDISSLTSENITYNNLTLDPAGTVTYNLGTAASQTLTVNGNLTIGDGSHAVTVTAATNNPAINLLGNLVINASAIYTKGSGTTIFKKGSTQTITDSTSGQDLGAVQISANGTATTLNLSSNATLTSLTIDASQNFGTGSNTLTVTGNGTPISIGASASLSTGTGTVTFASSGTTGTTVPNIAYNNLIVNKSGNTFTVASGGTLSIGGGLTVTAGTLDLNANSVATTVTGTLSNGGTLLAPAGNLTVSGDFTNNGTFTAGTGTVVLSPATTTQVTGSTDPLFKNLTSTSAGKTIKFASGNTFTISGTLTLTGATGNLINIQSTTPTSQWLVKFTGASTSTTYVSLKDSGCAIGSGNILMNDGTSTSVSNNGTCWKFSITAGFGGSGNAGYAPVEGGSGSIGSTGGGTVQGGGGATGGGSGSAGSTGGGTSSGGGGGAVGLAPIRQKTFYMV